MIIKDGLLKEIINGLSADPPESGGILGGKKSIVTSYAFDLGRYGRFPCSYTPDVGKLNAIIKGWSAQEIEFMGVFHTHFYGVNTLSEGDRAYIKQIMAAMPDGLECLYFPLIVFPDKEMIVYQASRSKNRSIKIIPDLLLIQN